MSFVGQYTQPGCMFQHLMPYSGAAYNVQASKVNCICCETQRMQLNNSNP